MKITSVYRKKIDSSLIRRLMYFIPNSEMNVSTNMLQIKP